MLLTALVLGIVEGLTEFLPISSTGHLILLGDLLGFQGPTEKLFDIVIQLGAILAVCWLYREKLFTAVGGLVRQDAKEWWFAVSLLLAFLPAVVLGALLHSAIKEMLFTPNVVAVAMIAGGLVILAVERFKPPPYLNNPYGLPITTSLKIGLFQCLSMIPGTSRSGATIIGALLLGVERKAATEFSFFLAIPTMIAATAYDVYKSRATLSRDDLELILAGFITAFLSAVLVVRWLVCWVARHGFQPFAWYRIVVGVGMLVMLQLMLA
jgi:undecaprenyl-diphosphatase